MHIVGNYLVERGKLPADIGDKGENKGENCRSCVLEQETGRGSSYKWRVWALGNGCQRVARFCQKLIPFYRKIKASLLISKITNAFIQF